MNIIEAMKAVKVGKRVARKLWEEGEYLKKSEFEQRSNSAPDMFFPKGEYEEEFVPYYGDYFAEDWEVVCRRLGGSMNFLEAMKAVKDGRKVARREWIDGEHVIAGEVCPVVVMPMILEEDDNFEDFLPLWEDYFAEDWYMEE